MNHVLKVQTGKDAVYMVLQCITSVTKDDASVRVYMTCGKCHTFPVRGDAGQNLLVFLLDQMHTRNYQVVGEHTV